MLVIGSENSSNSQRLKEVAQTQGRTAYLVEDKSGLRPEWFRGVRSVAVTAGASAPERLVRDLIDCLVERFGGTDVEEVRLVEENVRFALPARGRAGLRIAAERRRTGLSEQRARCPRRPSPPGSSPSPSTGSSARCAILITLMISWRRRASRRSDRC